MDGRRSENPFLAEKLPPVTRPGSRGRPRVTGQPPYSVSRALPPSVGPPPDRSMSAPIETKPKQVRTPEEDPPDEEGYEAGGEGDEEEDGDDDVMEGAAGGEENESAAATAAAAANIEAATAERARIARLQEQAAVAAAQADASLAAFAFGRGGGVMRSPPAAATQPVQQRPPSQTQPPQPPPLIQSPRRNQQHPQAEEMRTAPDPPPLPFGQLSPAPRPLQGAATGAIPKKSPLKPQQGPLFPAIDVRAPVYAPQPGAFRPVSAGRPQVLGQQQQMEIGESPPPPLGSASQTPAPYLSTADVRRGKTPGFVEDQTTPMNWNTPSLQLQGPEYNRDLLRKQYREQIRQVELQRTAEEATRLLNMELNTNMRRSRVQSEAENLRSRAQSVSVMLETMPLENVNLRSVEKDLARQRKRVEEAEAILEDDRKSRLATEEARLRENSSKRRRLVETERRLPEDDEVSSIYENDLSGPFMRIGKILYRVNDPAVRDNPEYIRRNNIHLEKINEEEISRGLEKSLEARDQINQANMTEAFGKIIGHYKAEVLNIVDENLGDRMRRIEENEKLSAKVMVEKKDEVRVLDLYVPEPGAPGEVYRKALQHSNGIVKVLERTITFQADPFNFTLLMCKESNKITADFGLSKTQQWNLIFAHLPPHEVTDFLYLTNDLVNLFKVVSTFATRVVTKQSLEKQINQWKLVNTSETDLNLSLVKLIDLLNKNREGYGTTPAHYPTLFKEAVGIIQRQEGLPRPVLEQLWKARMRVKDTDSVAEITQVLASACQRYIGMRSGKQAKVNQITVGDYENQFQNMMAQVKALAIGTQQQQQQNQNKNKQDGKKQQKQQQQKQQPQQQQQQTQQTQKQPQPQQQPQQQQQQTGQQNKPKKRYVPGFVQPWPANCSYLSKNGNMLKPEFESHFRGHCHKCGHSSHKALKCKTYPETTTILTLCERCRQGLHETCRSKRRDLAPQIDGQVKTIITTSLPQYTWPFAFPPPSQPAQITVINKSEAESDSD